MKYKMAIKVIQGLNVSFNVKDLEISVFSVYHGEEEQKLTLLFSVGS